MGSGNLTFQNGHERSLLFRRLSFTKKEGRHLSTAIGVSSIFNLNHATSLPLLVRVVHRSKTTLNSIPLLAFRSWVVTSLDRGVRVLWRSWGNLLQCMSLLIIEKLSEVDKERTSIKSSILSPWQPLLTCCCSFKSTRFHYHALIVVFSKHVPSSGRAMSWIVPTSSHSVEIVLHSRETTLYF